MTPEEHAAKRLGTVLGGRWTLERVLGVGGMAAVYAARAPDGSVAALKLLHTDSRLHHEVRQRFLREGQAANRVEHPGAVRVLDQATSDDDQTTYLVMELLEGESLAQRRAREPLTPDELLDVLDQTLDVLIAAHERGIIHRDLKPDNLFLTRDGRVKVLDFGIARFLDAIPGDVKTRTGIAMGTLPYMAPEQALGKRDQIDGRTDLFALGAVAFRLMTGRRVHEADSEAGLLVAMATLPAPPLKSVAPEVPNWIASIVDLALAFARDARYPDARTMQTDVRAVLKGSPPPYASRVTGARDEATRADRPAPKLEPAPAPVAPTTPGVPIAAAVSAPTLPSAGRGPALRAPPKSAWGAPTSTGTPPGYATARAPSATSMPGASSAHKPSIDRRLLIAGAGLALLVLVVLVVSIGLAATGVIGGTAADGGDGSPAFDRDEEKRREEQKDEDEERRETEKEAKEREKEERKKGR